MDKLTDKKNNGQREQDIKDSIMDKTSKLTGALYRVTALYSNKEPLKWTLRDNAITLYNELMSIMSVSPSGHEKSPQQFEEIIFLISTIIRALDLASLEGFIPEINFDILKKGYMELMALLEGGKNDFISEQKLLLEPELEFGRDGEVSKKTGGEAGKKAKTGAGAGKKSQDYRVNERKAKIMDFLRKNGRKTIKEISSIFEGISEKTIQRYLLDLVKAGELTAKGEKRWRTYGR